MKVFNGVACLGSTKSSMMPKRMAKKITCNIRIS